MIDQKTQMKIYAHCIIDHNQAIDNDIEGMGGTRIYNIPYRDIGIVVSHLDRQTKDVPKEWVLKHEEIAEKLMENFNVLPMRFLTVFNNEEDILDMMKDYHNDFRMNLDRLRNKVEFGLKIIWSAEEMRRRIINEVDKVDDLASLKDNSLAKSFMKEKIEKYKVDKALEKEADRYIVAIDNIFNKLSVEKKLQKLTTENLLLNASYLVEKEKQGDFKEAFKCAKNTPGDFKYLFSGPWPPYNFIVLTKKPDIFTPLEILKTMGNTSF